MTEQYPWKELKDVVEKERAPLSFLVYGPSGVGKTTFSSFFPRPLILACDPGILGGSLSALRNNPKHLKIESYDQVLKLLPLLKKAAWKEFDTLVIDSISYMGRLVMASILKAVGREIPRFEEWNLNAERMRKLINSFAEIGTHVVFTAVDSMTKDEVTGKIYGGPDLPGKLSKELPQACDIVLRLFVSSSYDSSMKKQTVYKYTTTPDDVWFARDRTGLLPAEGILSKDDPFKDFRILFQEKFVEKEEDIN